MKGTLRTIVAVAGGFALSFVGLGVLWIGTPWQYQALMFIPFFLLAFAVTRTGVAAKNEFLLVMGGAAPIAGLISLFRDKNDSHLMPMLMVTAWAAGVLAGHFLAASLPRKSKVDA